MESRCLRALEACLVACHQQKGRWVLCGSQILFISQRKRTKSQSRRLQKKTHCQAMGHLTKVRCASKASKANDQSLSLLYIHIHIHIHIHKLFYSSTNQCPFSNDMFQRLRQSVVRPTFLWSKQNMASAVQQVNHCSVV